MDNVNNILKNNKIVISVIIAMIAIGSIGGYFIYDNHRKTEILDKMKITFNTVKEVEYGTKEFDVKKTIVKDVKNAKLVKIPKLTTMKLGKVSLTFKLKKEDLTKSIQHSIKIVDTKGPEITLESDIKELTVGEEYDILSNIKGVKDPVDGDIQRIDPPTTDKGTKNAYYISGEFDINKVGEYKINITAIDKNGIQSTKEFTLIVKEKEIAPVINNSPSNTGSNSSSNNGGTTTKQSIDTVVNTALSQIGTPYLWGGTSPGGFDCSGLIYWAFNTNGYSIPRAVNGAGHSIGTNVTQAQVGDIMIFPAHSAMITSITPCGEEEGLPVYTFGVVTAYNGIGVTISDSGKIIRQDGKMLLGKQDWIDIRRVR